jgi:DNA-binding XRE family transcriptional regulator
VGFYTRRWVRRDLARQEFGRLFRAVRWRTGLSQEALGQLVGLSRTRITDAERRKGASRSRFTNWETICRIGAGLSIPTDLLAGYSLTPGREREAEDWMDRRTFHNTILAAIFGGIGASAAADEDRLRSILPSPGSEPTPRRIGTNEVNAIRAATTGYRSSHFQYGGGLMRAAAVAQLDYVLKLRGAQSSDSVRSDLAFATAELSNTAAWMSFTANRHEDARRLWAIALNGARESGHPQSADLMVETLMNAAVQSLHLGKPDEVVSLAKYASSLMTTPGAAPVSAPTRHYTYTHLAHAYARMGDASSCRASLDQSEQALDNADTGPLPAWTSYVSEGSRYLQNGISLTLLARKDQSHAVNAVDHLRRSLSFYSPERQACDRALALSSLASAYVHVGDLGSAVSTGHEAVTLVSGTSSIEPHPALEMLQQLLVAHANSPDVAHLRHDIRELVSPTAI